jgi:hypothetical protein
MIDEYGAFDGMTVGRENPSVLIKPVPMPLCPPQIPLEL